MEANPFVAMLDACRPQEVGGALVLGKVVSTTPLRVLCEGNTLERDDLLCNADCTTEGVGAVIVPGAQLLMVPMEERQRYIIICKVVSL